MGCHELACRYYSEHILELVSVAVSLFLIAFCQTLYSHIEPTCLASKASCLIIFRRMLAMELPMPWCFVYCREFVWTPFFTTLNVCIQHNIAGMPLNKSVQHGHPSPLQMHSERGGKLLGSTPVPVAFMDSCATLLLGGGWSGRWGWGWWMMF